MRTKILFAMSLLLPSLLYAQTTLFVVLQDEGGLPAEQRFFTPERIQVISEVKEEIEYLLSQTTYPSFQTQLSDGFSIEYSTSGSSFTDISMPANAIQVNLGKFNSAGSGLMYTDIASGTGGTVEKRQEFSTRGTPAPSSASFSNLEEPVRTMTFLVGVNTAKKWTQTEAENSVPSFNPNLTVNAFEDVLRHEMFHGVFGVATDSPGFQQYVETNVDGSKRFVGPNVVEFYPNGIPLAPDGKHVAESFQTQSLLTGAAQQSMMVTSPGSNDATGNGNEFDLTIDVILMLKDMGFEVPFDLAFPYPNDDDDEYDDSGDWGEDGQNGTPDDNDSGYNPSGGGGGSTDHNDDWDNEGWFDPEEWPDGYTGWTTEGGIPGWIMDTFNEWSDDGPIVDGGGSGGPGGYTEDGFPDDSGFGGDVKTYGGYVDPLSGTFVNPKKL